MENKDNKTAHNSKEYDDNIRLTIPFYDIIHKEASDLIKAYNPNPYFWIDTGCGTGNFASIVCQEFKNTKFILADPSFEMLNIAINKNQNNKNIISFEIFPSEQIQDYITQSPDVITAIQCHHYYNKEERINATQACFDILKSKGIFIVTENIRPFSEQGIELGKSRWINFQINSGKDKLTATKHMDRFDSEYFPITIYEHFELYKKCGFKTVELFWYSQMQAGFYCIKE